MREPLVGDEVPSSLSVRLTGPPLPPPMLMRDGCAETAAERDRSEGRGGGKEVLRALKGELVGCAGVPPVLSLL